MAEGTAENNKLIIYPLKHNPRLLPLPPKPPNIRCAADFSNLAPLMEAKLAKQTFKQSTRRPDVCKCCKYGRVISFDNTRWLEITRKRTFARFYRSTSSKLLKKRVLTEKKASLFVVTKGSHLHACVPGGGRVVGVEAPSGLSNRRLCFIRGSSCCGAGKQGLTRFQLLGKHLRRRGEFTPPHYASIWLIRRS